MKLILILVLSIFMTGCTTCKFTPSVDVEVTQKEKSTTEQTTTEENQPIKDLHIKDKTYFRLSPSALVSCPF